MRHALQATPDAGADEVLEAQELEQEPTLVASQVINCFRPP